MNTSPDQAKFQEYRNLIAKFRITDLQITLRFARASPKGLKHELVERVISLLATDFKTISSKIEEVYQQLVEEKNKLKRRKSLQMRIPDNQSSENNMQLSSDLSSNVQIQIQPTEVPLHQNFRHLYNVLATLIEPSLIAPLNILLTYNWNFFYFQLTPKQVQEIALSNGHIQVQLRFCRLSYEQNDFIPPNIILLVNGKQFPLGKRIDSGPLNITNHLLPLSTDRSFLAVKWPPDCNREYCLAAYLVRQLTITELLHQIKKISANYTREMIKKKILTDEKVAAAAEGDDCEITTSQWTISLNCPLSKSKMLIPCRALTCSHIQCFDAAFYLEINQHKSKWKCPLCDKTAFYKDLRIDGYFQEILSSSSLDLNDTNILLHNDGSCSVNRRRATKFETIDLTSNE